MLFSIIIVRPVAIVSSETAASETGDAEAPADAEETTEVTEASQAGTETEGSAENSEAEDELEAVKDTDDAASFEITARPENVAAEIGESDFENSTNLVNIDLPDTIELIGRRAFEGCSNLGSMC